METRQRVRSVRRRRLRQSRVGFRLLPELTRCPRQESNLRTWLRRPMLYPLSYEGLLGLCPSTLSVFATSKVPTNGSFSLWIWSPSVPSRTAALSHLQLYKTVWFFTSGSRTLLLRVHGNRHAAGGKTSSTEARANRTSESIESSNPRSHATSRPFSVNSSPNFLCSIASRTSRHVPSGPGPG